MAATQEDPLYFIVAEDRLRGVLGSRCTEAELARRYDVSRTRIVRLLSQMAQEGLVLRLPGNGWEFLPVLSSPEAYDQGYRYRMLIEPASLLEPGYTLSNTVLSEARRKQQAMLAGGIHAWSLTKIEPVGVADLAQALAALAEGRADALALGRESLIPLLERFPGSRILNGGLPNRRMDLDQPNEPATAGVPLPRRAAAHIGEQDVWRGLRQRHGRHPGRPAV